MPANLVGCAILLLVIVKSGNAISGREEMKQGKVIGAGNCTYDMDCPGAHPCCVLEDKETVCGQCTIGDINFFEVNGRGPKLTFGPGELNPGV